MEALKRMCDSIEYIESYIETKIDMEELASVAYMSKFHYQRLFHMLTGVPVGEYIRNRKLTKAAQELAYSRIKVIDLALKYGYETPESFSKAFRKVHGISPTQARLPETTLKAYPKLTFQIQLKGDIEMNYKIVEKEAFKVIGKGKRVSTVDGVNHTTIPVFWKECSENGFTAKLAQYSGENLMGICMDFTSELDEFTYFIGIDKSDIQLSLEEREIPASTWAVFESVGPLPQSIQKVWGRIFSEWFPSTGYEHAATPEIEVYPSGNTTAEDYRCEIWVPIIKKVK